MDSVPITHYISFLGERDTRRSLVVRLLKTNKAKARAAAFVAVLAITGLCFLFFSLRSVPMADEGFDRLEVDPTLRNARPVDIWRWTDQDFMNDFDAFVGEHGKVYESTEERNLRFNIFKKNLYYIHTHNTQGYNFSLKMNAFGDMTDKEFKRGYVAYRKSSNNGLQSLGVNLDLLSVDTDDLPKAKDWREAGCVTGVKNQDTCGSCWAFSATGALEGALCAQAKKYVNLSEQQLVDCSKAEGNNGCNGGDMDIAFQYIKANNGLCSEEGYPYHGKDEECKSSACSPVATLTGFQDVPHNNEMALRRAIAKYGPVSVAIEADQVPFQFYEKGVFTAECGSQLDHGVLVVGYGTDEKLNQDYWIVKNSWGPSWGEHGFIRLVRNREPKGECGILMDPSYPVVI